MHSYYPPHELPHMRCKNLENQYWRTVSERYMKERLGNVYWKGKDINKYRDELYKHVDELNEKCTNLFHELVGVN